MDRIYRVSTAHGPEYIVERDGTIYSASVTAGGIFDGYRLNHLLEPPLSSWRLLPPVQPSTLVCVGLNYRDHAAEMNKAVPNEPMLFLKPTTAVTGPSTTIWLPPGVGRVDHEAELAVVIGQRARRVRRADAWDYVFGLTCLNDVTARDIQSREVQYTRAKGFDSFAPLGPCVATGLVGTTLTVEASVGGERRQSSSTDRLIFPIDELIEYITFTMTLNPGDVIATGTPSGVGPLVPGDIVTVTVEGVGSLTNYVAAEDPSGMSLSEPLTAPVAIHSA